MQVKSGPLSRLAASFVLLWSAVPSAALASWPGDNGRIAYLDSEGDKGHIFDIGPQGGAARRLTPRVTRSLSPSYSPDGRWIAFERILPSDVGRSNFDIFIMAADGSSVTRLTRTEKYDEWFPTFSPSGSRILFSRKSPRGKIDLFLMRRNGGHPRRITSKGGREIMAKWSPDGDRIAYINGHQGLITIHPDGSDKAVVSPEARTFDWRPDGDRFVIHADFGHARHFIYSIKEDGTGRRGIIEKGDWSLPVWSPNGRWIVAQGPRQGLFRVRPSGRDLESVKRRTSFLGAFPTWQPR